MYSKNALDWRWIMRDHYFSQVFIAENITVQMLFIDTIYLAPHAIDSTPVDYPDLRNSEELAWIDEQLNASSADWIFVIGHYPLYSIGEHGDTVVLQGALKNLLEKYSVDAYICGHDHTLQHLTKGEIEYFISGNGGKRGSLKDVTSTAADSVKFAKVDPGFMIHEVGTDNMTVTVIDYQGAFIYNFTQHKKNRQSAPPSPPTVTLPPSLRPPETEIPTKSPSSSSSLTFFTIGDWGKPGTIQSDVAAQMARSALQYDISFIVSTGDNFYETGVADEFDSQWNKTWLEVYDYPSLNVKWYAVLGNHDYVQNPDAQIRYYEQSLNWKWVMEDHYYSKLIHLNNDEVNTSVLLLFIDTNYWENNDNPEFQSKGIAELQWIDESLRNSTADWKIVVGHHVIFSIGEHGDSVALKNTLQPILEKNQVNAYISGHDHTLQHLSKGSIQYFVSGNGGKMGSLQSVSTTSADQVNFARVDPGFMIHEVEKFQMNVTMVDSKGISIYNYMQVRRPAVVITPTQALTTQPSAPYGDEDNSSNLIPILITMMFIASSIAGGIWLFRRHRARAGRYQFDAVQFEEVKTSASP
eukprot:TRINITY_DN6280_c0_g1_i1.p1 TRINITY_DN6280_c0_g1~~TRINITY_DN6280_c0_g1_i1.p1  ORF type:complete len:581 (+),score=152.65 TRINITY_DN6280_c0_g1_i1:240-1982(+)